MKKRFFEVNGGFCLFLLSVVFFTEFAQAQTITPSNAGPLNSTSLYAVIEGNYLYEYADIKSATWSSQRREVWRNSFVHSTLAVGPYYPSGTFGDGNPVLVAYFWGYADNGVTIRRVIPDPVGGNSSIQTFTVSNAVVPRVVFGVLSIQAEVYPLFRAPNIALSKALRNSYTSKSCVESVGFRVHNYPYSRFAFREFRE